MSQLTTSIWSGILDQDVAQAIILSREANEAPVYAALTAAGQVADTGTERFDWQTDAFATRETAINNGGSAYDGTTTSLVVDSGAVFYPNCLIYAKATGEIMLCTAVSTNTITVVRGIGSVVAAAAGSVADNAVLINIGTAEGEGKDPPASRFTSRTTVQNWVQKFEHTVEISGRVNAQQTKTQNEREYQEREKIFRHHIRDIEHALIFGAADGSTTDAGSKNVTTTGGLVQAISTHVTNIGGNLTEALINTFSEKAFAEGPGEKIAFCGATVLGAIHSIYGGRVRYAAMADTAGNGVGLKAETLITPYGTLQLVFNRRLSAALPGSMIVVNPQAARLRYLPGRRTALVPITTEADASKSVWRTEVGLEWGAETEHAHMKGVTGAA